MMWGYNDYELAANAIGCHPISVRRWEQRITPFRMTGNRQRQWITAADQLLLSICLFIYPEANQDQICIFIVANGGDVYTRPTVSKRCKELGLSRKRSSREAYEAYSPASIQKAIWFQTEVPPLGINGVDTASLIDIDETGFYLKNLTTKYGRSHTTCRVRTTSHYARAQQKLNVIVAI